MSTKIQYCDESINPIRTSDGGYHCTKVSPGCKHCFGEGFNNRFGNHKPYDNSPAEFVINRTAMQKPYQWKKHKRIFVQDMSDLFLGDIAINKQLKVLELTQVYPQHTLLFLTKRPLVAKLAIDYYLKHRIREKIMPPNFWIGVSAENQATANERIPILLQVPAAVHWVSMEPMLGPVGLTNYLKKYSCRECGWEGNNPLNQALARGRGDMEFKIFQFCPSCKIMIKETDGWKIIEPPSIDWVVCGGETGPGARPMHPDWPRRVRDDCVAAGVLFWFKGWGEWVPEDQNWGALTTRTAMSALYVDSRNGETKPAKTGARGDYRVTVQRVGKKRSGNRLDGKIWEQLP